MIVPEDGAGMRKWRVTSRRYTWFKAGFWFTCLFLLLGLVSMISVVVLYGKLHQYKQFNHQLLEATAKLEMIAERLDSYEEKEKKLRAILGSDFELPEAMAVDPNVHEKKSSDSASGGDELEQAIAKEEARLRKLPTKCPVEAWQISKKFLNTKNPRTDHYGIDILAPIKTGVAASADGEVIFAGMDSNFGRMVVIDHGNGWQTKYGHLESILVKPGVAVQKGHLIAVFGGSEGSSTGAHLHFGMFYKGQPVNPLVWLEERPILDIAKNN